MLFDPNATPFERANFYMSYLESQDDYKTFDGCLKDNLKLVSASISPTDPNVATTVFSLRVQPPLTNGMGNLHGGAVALIFDMCTSVTISCVAREDFWDTGHVSRTLNCTYLRPAPEGTELLVDSEIVHLGKSMGMTRGVIRRKSDGAVCYVCEHGKARTGGSRL